MHAYVYIYIYIYIYIYACLHVIHNSFAYILGFQELHVSIGELKTIAPAWLESSYSAGMNDCVRI